MLVSGHVIKGNASGTGFFRFLSEITYFKVNDSIMVNCLGNLFFSKISYYDGFGFYVPKNIVSVHNLLNKKLKISLRKASGFCVKAGYDCKITLPHNLLNKYQLREDDVVRIKIIKPYKTKFYTKIFKINRAGRPPEYALIVKNKDLRSKTLVLDIDSKLPRFVPVRKANQKFLNITAFFKTKPLFKFNKNHILIHFRNNYLIIPQKVVLSNNLALYLGAFFADGTKKGNYWRINASTPNQAKFYIKMHNYLCSPKKLKYNLTVTDSSDIESTKLKKELNLFWYKESNIDLSKIYLLPPKGIYKLKINNNGSLSICDYRQDVLVFYRNLLYTVTSKIMSMGNSRLARYFFLGLLEGDGSAGAVRGIVLTTNLNDAFIIEKILNVSNLNYNKYKEKENKIYFKIGVLELIKNQWLLKNIFLYYPKRRKRFIKRLFEIGVIKHFFDTKRKTSSWIKAWLRREGIVNKNYELTKKGKMIKNILIKMRREIEQ